MAGNISGYSGAFVPTTNVWDTAELKDIDVTKPEFKELLVRLYQNLNYMAQSVNLKDTGYYYTQEFVNGQKYFANPSLTSASTTTPSPRQVFRQVVNFGALPNTTTKSVPHHITCTANTSFTRIYGTATEPSTSYVPIPYASASGATIIELYVDPTNVNITTNFDARAYTITYIVVEYLQS